MTLISPGNQQELLGILEECAGRVRKGDVSGLAVVLTDGRHMGSFMLTGELLGLIPASLKMVNTMVDAMYADKPSPVRRPS